MGTLTNSLPLPALARFANCAAGLLSFFSLCSLNIGCPCRPLAADEHEPRVWRDQSGQHEIVARFVRLEGATVVLEVAPERSPGFSIPPPGTGPIDARPPVLEVPCERLALEDQQYVATHTLPKTVDAQTIRMELMDVEQRIMLPLAGLPRTWDYEAILLSVQSNKKSLDLQALQASESNVAETARQVRTATLKNVGHFHIPVEYSGGDAQVRVMVQMRQFQDALVLCLRPTVKVGNKAIEFAARPLFKEAITLERSIALNQQKLLLAQRDLKILPVEIQRTQKMLLPNSVPGAQLHNAQVLLRLGKLESGLQRSHRNLHSANKSLPIDAARLKQIKFIREVVQRYIDKVDLELRIQRRCGELIQPVLTARQGGRIALGPALPALNLEP